MQFQLPGQTGFYRGKVRDVYTIDNKWIVMVASDRISAFDVVLPRPVPFKGQVLNQLSAFMLNACSDICPIWLRYVPAPNVSIGNKCEPFKIEMVVRGNLAGHAWRTYSAGGRNLCGAEMPEGMKENDFFPNPIVTPSTKASEGHDEDISPAAIIETQLCTAEEWKKLEEFSLRLFARGKELAAKRNLILADTKYEFGLLNGDICLMDEIHTPDSSRYFYAEGFGERQQRGEKQKQLSKEFVREWLIANNFMGKRGQEIPEMKEEWLQEISSRYIELYEAITGSTFIPEKITEQETAARIIQSLDKIRN